MADRPSCRTKGREWTSFRAADGKAKGKIFQEADGCRPDAAVRPPPGIGSQGVVVVAFDGDNAVMSHLCHAVHRRFSDKVESQMSPRWYKAVQPLSFR